MAAPPSGSPPTSTSAARARDHLAEAARPLGTESVALAAAVGRIAGEDVLAPEDLPSFARSAVDGYAVRAADLAAAAAAPARLTLAGTIAAGDAIGATLAPGETWAVATGAPLPAAADAVVMVERARREGSVVEFAEALPAGRNLIARGEDVGAGGRVVQRGKRLGPRDLALLAAVGLDRVVVARRPRVAVLSSGAELVPADHAAGAGRVRDVNQPALAAAVLAAGGDVTSAGIVGDDVEALARALAALAGTHDLVLVTGGTSVGAADHTAAALRRLGARMLYHGLAVRPGRPTLAAVLAAPAGGADNATIMTAATTALVIGLPGVPAAALCLYEVFVRPVLAGMLGAIDLGSPGSGQVRAILTTAIDSAKGREDYVRVRLDRRLDGAGAVVLMATPITGASSSLFALAKADGVAIVPDEVEGVAAGEAISVLVFQG